MPACPSGIVPCNDDDHYYRQIPGRNLSRRLRRQKQGYASSLEYLKRFSSSTSLKCFHLSADRDLHDVQEFVEQYRYKKATHRFLYSKSDGDELQRLGKRVDDTLSLYQVRLPLTVP